MSSKAALRIQGETMYRSSLVAPLLILTALACGRNKPLENRSDVELEKMLNDSDATKQAQGAFGLSQHGEKARNAVPTLIRLLESPDTLVRQEACVALGNMGRESVAAVPVLVKVLDDPEWNVRRQAIIALGQIEPPLEEVEAPLQRCEKDAQSTLVRKAAKSTLAILRKNKL
jgi:hypothetical protein